MNKNSNQTTNSLNEHNIIHKTRRNNKKITLKIFKNLVILL